jgi:hypothetical protein
LLNIFRDANITTRVYSSEVYLSVWIVISSSKAIVIVSAILGVRII